MTKLPRKVQPRALAHKYPRIANKLAHLWTTSDALDAYLDGLVTDRRGNRQGFAEEIRTELRLLAGYTNAKYTQLAKDAWAEEPLSKH